MIPRQEVFDTYWKIAAERQKVFFARFYNDPPPWTDDPIINNYKFCNAYRASDRVSQFLIKDVIYSGHKNFNETDIIFRILLFRIFNKIETWQYLENKLGDIKYSNFEITKYGNLLQESLNLGHPIFTSAFILCASKVYGYNEKHLNFLTLIDEMMKDKIVLKITQSKSLKDVFTILKNYPLIGNFMAYQLAIDLNYSEVINFSENDFTIAGPGAERGIKKCFLNTQGKNNEYIIKWMTENQDREFKRLGIQFQNLWGRSLHFIDCQGIFCETDKYSRISFPKLKSNRKQIKAKFKPNVKSFNYFYPPKWGINDKIKQAKTILR
jgi:hypothetical protein